MPLRLFEGAGQHAVVMQDGADVDHVHAVVRRAEGQHRAHEPVFQFVALLRGTHVLVVFQIVKQNQVRAVRTVPQAAHALARAESLYLDVAGRDDGAHVPDAPLAALAGEIGHEARVAFQLHLDGLQEAGRLLEGVGYQQNIALAARDHAPQQEKHVHKGGLGLAARGRAGLPDAFRVVHGGGQGRVQPQVQSAIAGGRAVLAACVVRKIRPPEKGKVPLHTPDTLGTGLCVGREAGAVRLDGTAQAIGQGRKFRPKVVRCHPSHDGLPVFPPLRPRRAPALPAAPPHAGGTAAARTRSASGSRAGPRTARWSPAARGGWR